MTLSEIKKLPTTTYELKRDKEISDDVNIHESLFRSYHILEKVEEMLVKEVPHDFIIEVIEDLRSKDAE